MKHIRILQIIGLGFLAYLTSSSTHANTMPQDNLFSLYGKSYTKQSLSPRHLQALSNLEEEFYRSAYELAKKIALDEFKKKATPEELKKFEVVVSDADATKFYNENSAAMQGNSFDVIKPQLIVYLKGLELKKVEEAVLQNLIREKKFTFLLPPPIPPKHDIPTTEYPTKGTGKVHIVEFADYYCPHCQQVSGNLKEVFELPEMKGKLKLTFIDFPLTKNFTIAEAAHCAREQDLFWQFHYLAFKKQNTLFSTNAIKDLIDELKTTESKLNSDSFLSCVASNRYTNKIQTAKDLGTSLGVEATPAIYLNGQKVSNPSVEVLKSAIQKALESK